MLAKLARYFKENSTGNHVLHRGARRGTGAGDFQNDEDAHVAFLAHVRRRLQAWWAQWPVTEMKNAPSNYTGVRLDDFRLKIDGQSADGSVTLEQHLGVHVDHPQTVA